MMSSAFFKKLHIDFFCFYDIIKQKESIMENKFKDEIIVDLDNVFVVTTIDDEYNIAVVSPKKPRKAYYVCSGTITNNVVTKEDEEEELDKIDYGDDDGYGAYADYALAKTRIDDYKVDTLIDFISKDYRFDYNFAEKCSIVEKLIGNQHRISIQQLKNFEKLFNDENFKTKEEIEYERREKQKQEDDKILDELFR